MLDLYRRQCEERFLGTLRAARRFANAMYRYPRLLLHPALRHEEVVRKYVSCIDRPHGYRTFSFWFALRLPRLWLT
jgi:hypothetical protein